MPTLPEALFSKEIPAFGWLFERRAHYEATNLRLHVSAPIYAATGF
jgi:hypothetical protein